MTAAGVTLLVVFLLLVLAAVKPLGLYMAHIFEGRQIWPLRVGAPLERGIYRLAGVDAAREMDWKEYAAGLLLFNALGALTVYLLQRCQLWLPLNPQNFANISPDSAFNTAVSFITNTNWQGYSGESAMGYLIQMAGLAVQNFLSAASGIVVAIALVRGLARHSVQTIGNLWSDLTRATLYVLLPIAVVLALALVSQGVIQNFSAYKDVTTVEPLTYQQPKTDTAGNPVKDAAGNTVQETVTTHTQTLPMGPIASQESIKELGTNGGGFFNANSAHPYENPTALSNLLEILAIIIIPAALTYTFGRMVGDTRQGWAVFAAMLILFVSLLSVAAWNEQRGNPQLARLGVDQAASPTQSGGNMEGKEARFGIAASALFATATTATSCGAVNSLHDSYTPLGGFVPLFQMQLGEVVFGGVGTGLYSMLIFAIVGVFIAGLSANTPFYNVALALTMWLGRFWPIVAVLAVAGSLAAKKRVPVSDGTMPTHGPTFVVLLIGTVLLVGALTFVPALALGPIVEHVMLWAAS